MKTKILLSIPVITLCLLVTPSVFAARPLTNPQPIRPAQSLGRSDDNEKDGESNPSQNLGRRPTGKVSGQLRSCEARLDAVKTRSENLTNFTDRVIKTFDAITTRVEGYYTQKVVPSGTPVANYSQLVNDITVKKAAAQAALTKAQATTLDFDCNTGAIKTALQNFNQQMKAVKLALSDYRTSVKNLIVAIRSRQGAADEETGRPTAKPTRAPRPTSGGER
ncbi:hypothetical protein M1116_02145 [Patescibacteria group bacterium]|nr:hypothetical protein [Patescibacteria group bacterium]